MGYYKDTIEIYNLTNLYLKQLNSWNKELNLKVRKLVDVIIAEYKNRFTRFPEISVARLEKYIIDHVGTYNTGSYNNLAIVLNDRIINGVIDEDDKQKRL